jgi:hypothetical protein
MSHSHHMPSLRSLATFKLPSLTGWYNCLRGYHRLEFPPIVMFKVFLTSGAAAGSVVYMSGKKLIKPGEPHPIFFVPPAFF